MEALSLLWTRPANLGNTGLRAGADFIQHQTDIKPQNSDNQKHGPGQKSQQNAQTGPARHRDMVKELLPKDPYPSCACRQGGAKPQNNAKIKRDFGMMENGKRGQPT